MRNFNLTSILGSWYVMQYYASSEEVSEYSCMRSVFSMHEEHVSIYFKLTNYSCKILFFFLAKLVIKINL